MGPSARHPRARVCPTTLSCFNCPDASHVLARDDANLSESLDVMESTVLKVNTFCFVPLMVQIKAMEKTCRRSIEKHIVASMFKSAALRYRETNMRFRALRSQLHATMTPEVLEAIQNEIDFQVYLLVFWSL
jgi:hypothetical protein